MEFTKWHVIGICLLIAIGGLFLFGATYISERIKEAHDAPSDVERTLSLSGLSLEGGGSLDIARLNGKIVVVASWATWCPSCHQMLFDLSRAKDRFKDNIEVIAVNRAEEQRVVDDYRTAMKLPKNLSYVTDPEDEYFNSINGRSMPELIIHTRDGLVAEHRIDAPTFDTLMTTLEALTKE